MSNRITWLLFVSMTAILAGCGDANASGREFVGEWSCVWESNTTSTVSIRHNGGNNYIYEGSAAPFNLTYKNGKLEGVKPHSGIFVTLVIDKQSNKLLGTDCYAGMIRFIKKEEPIRYNLGTL